MEKLRVEYPGIFLELLVKLFFSKTIFLTLYYNRLMEIIVDDERLQRASNNRQRRLWRGIRLPESGYRQDVRHEMPG